MDTNEAGAEFSSFSEDDWKRQVAADEASIAQLMNQDPGQGPSQMGISFDFSVPFDQSEKAEDAQDFEDISDDDLPDEEEPADAAVGTGEVPGLTDDGGTSHDTDDLFGEGRESSPLHAIADESQPAPTSHPAPPQDEHAAPPATPAIATADSVMSWGQINFDPEPHFHGSANQDPDIPAPAETVEDFIKQTWPGWSRGKILNWNELLPPKKATWIEKRPLRPPKPLVPTKLSLEFEPDQEKLFRIPGPAQATLTQKLHDLKARGLEPCLDKVEEAEDDVEDFLAEEDDGDEPVGGFTLQDFVTVCEDWDAAIDPPSPVVVKGEDNVRIVDEDMDDWDQEFLQDAAPPPAKRRKLFEPGLPQIARFKAPSFDNFEQATARAAKRVRLDLNDPYLLLDDVESERVTKRPKVQHKLVRMANGKLGRDVFQRYNISNDEAYDALKDNQSKVRATLSNLAVEHSMPALKLVWPYYRVKPVMTHARSFHRPGLQVRQFMNHTIRFAKPQYFKRKNFKGLKVQDIYKESKDLTLNDNSYAVLFEYCEETPTALANFGMGNRIINYYRRKEGDDEKSRPKLELGEPGILLPEDRSPFSIFGTVDTGETVPTFHNQMYRAPIFKHKPRSTDFLCGRSTTGLKGTTWYVRNIDHLYVVGQTFPSVEIPGPHSRKVTNVAKNRVKMISYRLMRHDPGQHVTLPAVTRHIADSTDSQNRQKLKEFLHYNKEEKQWGLKPGETLMDEAGIRSMIKPEDTCLIEAMQVGMQNLYDAGFDPKNTKFDDNEEDDEKVDGPSGREEPLPKRMAPWRTTKAFIDACAGKAMVQLHGEGDPTGHGLGFSFLKTSMKGGYISAVQGPLATSADAIERERKANNGHLYNVKQQEAMYMQGIRGIWGKQKATLSDPTEHEDEDVQPTVDEDERFNVAKEPAATPAYEDGMSQVSRLTGTSRTSKRRIRITRTKRNPTTGNVETYEEVIEDPVVIQHYIRRRNEMAAEKRDIYEIKPTGNDDIDRQERLRIEKELSRLERNQERRFAREKQKSLLRKAAGMATEDGDAGSPEAVGSVEKVAAGTTRKCANCGQIGHIKTNKKYVHPRQSPILAPDRDRPTNTSVCRLCPMLNGTWTKENKGDEHGGFGGYNAPSMPSFSSAA